MSVLKLKITTLRPNSYLVDNFQRIGPVHSVAEGIAQYIARVQTGTELAESTSAPPSINIVAQGSQTQATGTLTLTTVIATDAIKINGVTFTAVASGATGNQFNVGVNDTATAVNLAASINASTTDLVSGYVTASSALTVVTVTSSFYGLAGNTTTLESLDGTIVASVAQLVGGAEDAGALTLSF